MPLPSTKVSLSLASTILLAAIGRPGLSQNPDCRGIWITPQELAVLPMSGAAWDRLLARANESAGSPDISDQENPVNVRVMAKALVHARTGTERYRTDVVNACMAAIGTEAGGRTLALGRELVAYVIAADLVGLPADKDATFRTWLRRTLTESLDGMTLVSTHEKRPNNWGTHAGASRAAVAAYLGDDAELDRCARVFKGWLGDRALYAGFSYGDLSWQSDRSRPVGINPKGATISGHSVDGVLPDDQRRAGGFTWPPSQENYVYEALQGAIVQGVILHRFGRFGWTESDSSLLRAYTWLQEVNSFDAEGDDTWQPHLVNFYYKSTFPAPVPSTPGKNVGWTDWTHATPSAIRTGVHGVVRDASGNEVSGSDVKVLSGTALVATARSNAHGQFRFINLPAGAYDLVCSTGGGTTSGPKRITLTQGSQLFAADLTAAPGQADTIPPVAPENVRLK